MFMTQRNGAMCERLCGAPAGRFWGVTLVGLEAAAEIVRGCGWRRSLPRRERSEPAARPGGAGGGEAFPAASAASQKHSLENAAGSFPGGVGRTWERLHGC